MITSGSHDAPVGALLFEEDGTMHLSLMSTLNECDSAAITLITDFFQYALSREDWMLLFVDHILSEKPLNNSNTKHSLPGHPHLRVIEGGKSGTSGSQ